MKRALLPIAVTLLLAGPAHAQFWDSLINPDVQVTLTHPPGLGLKVQRVAFAPVNGNEADELVSACISDLSADNRIEVLDRGNIEKVLKEQKLSNSGMVDSAQAVELGKMLGSPVLLFVKVFNLKINRTPLRSSSSYKDKQGLEHTTYTYTSKTQADFSASIQAVDLATGRIYSQKRIAVSPAKENTSNNGQPEYPSETEVREMALALARSEVNHMLLSWDEPRKLIFYDDKDYGMKDAYKSLQIKDYPGALTKSQEALAKAKADSKVKPKYIGRTNYNVGMCFFILGDYTSALPYLQAARVTDPSHKIFAQAGDECDRALKLRLEMERVDSRSAQAGAAPEPQRTTSASSTPTGTPSIEDRLQRLDNLKKKGLLTPEEYQKRKDEIMKEL
jgi:tetratricopeptide (TPR) repeat protein